MERIHAWNAGMEQFASQPLVDVVWKPNTTYILNDEAKTPIGLELSIQSYQTLNCVGIHGSMNSPVCTSVNNVLSWRGIPHMSGSCSTPSLSSKAAYPTFVRSVGSSRLNVVVLLAYFHRMKWNKIGIIYQEGGFGLGILHAAQLLAGDFDIEIGFIMPVPNNFNALEIDVTKEFDLVQTSGYNIFLMGIPNPDFSFVMREFHKRGMTNNPNYYFGGDFSWVTLHSDPLTVEYFGGEDIHNHVRGLTFSSPSVAFGTDAHSLFETKYRAYTGNSEPSLAATWAYFWDSAHWVSLSLNNAVKVLNDAGIDPNCLKESVYQASPSTCQIPDSLRDSIFQVANCSTPTSTSGCVKREGVLKTMLYRKASSRDKYGVLSNKAIIVYLNELYGANFTGATGPFVLDANGDRAAIIDLQNAQTINGTTTWVKIGSVQNGKWQGTTQAVFPGGTANNPNTIPPTNQAGGVSSSSGIETWLLAVIIASGVLVLTPLIVLLIMWRVSVMKRSQLMHSAVWIVNIQDVVFDEKEHGKEHDLKSLASSDFGSSSGQASDDNSMHIHHRRSLGRIQLPTGNHAMYKGESVNAKVLNFSEKLDLKSQRVLTALYLAYQARHPHLALFVGITISPPKNYILEEYCEKGSMEDVIYSNDFHLDHVFVFSLSTDVARGLQFLHKSELEVHGRLKPGNCLIDSKWTCKLSTYGLSPLFEYEELEFEEDGGKEAKMLWTPPEMIEPLRLFFNHKATETAKRKAILVKLEKIDSSDSHIHQSQSQASARSGKFSKASTSSAANQIFFPQSQAADIWGFWSHPLPINQ